MTYLRIGQSAWSRGSFTLPQPQCTLGTLAGAVPSDSGAGLLAEACDVRVTLLPGVRVLTVVGVTFATRWAKHLEPLVDH